MFTRPVPFPLRKTRVALAMTSSFKCLSTHPRIYYDPLFLRSTRPFLFLWSYLGFISTRPSTWRSLTTILAPCYSYPSRPFFPASSQGMLSWGFLLPMHTRLYEGRLSDYLGESVVWTIICWLQQTVQTELPLGSPSSSSLDPPCGPSGPGVKIEHKGSSFY